MRGLFQSFRLERASADTYHFFVSWHDIGRRIGHGHENAVHDDAQHNELKYDEERKRGTQISVQAKSKGLNNNLIWQWTQRERQR